MIRVSGSSPLARGLPQISVTQKEQMGIIPARAGFTIFQHPTDIPAGDHPRSRGVYSLHSQCSTTQGGSSPLARGLRVTSRNDYLEGRIIPARAGFTSGCSPSTAPERDHPRSRGVYAPPSVGTAGTSGSSPLARGLREVEAVHSAVLGIIPARAGFTGVPLACGDTPPDHPRSRGVYALKGDNQARETGSSPLARGLHSL